MKGSSSEIRKRKVRFQLKTKPGSKVFLAGTFNGWNPKKDKMKDNPQEGLFAATLLLPCGRHEYKFVVDGEWLADPTCEAWVPNEHGSLNSVIEI
jgi:1,4-alpha-glucan branching enzyme